jgi:hypothetical protein
MKPPKITPPQPDTTPEQIKAVVSTRAEEIRARLNAARAKNGLKPVSNTQPPTVVVPAQREPQRTTQDARVILSASALAGAGVGFIATRAILGGFFMPLIVGVAGAGVAAYTANTMFSQNNVPVWKQAFPEQANALESIDEEIARLTAEYERLKDLQNTCKGDDCMGINKRILELSSVLMPSGMADVDVLM